MAGLTILVVGCDSSSDTNTTATDSGEIPMTAENIKQLIYDLEGEINNGGFDQFFFNSAGDQTQETIDALEKIGATHTAEIVKRAAAKFPNGMPSPDRGIRQEQLDLVSPDSDAFEAEDKAFLEYVDDLESLVEALMKG